VEKKRMSNIKARKPPFLTDNGEPKCYCLLCNSYIYVDDYLEYPKLQIVKGIPTIAHDSCVKKVLSAKKAKL